ncbi:MAG: alpha-amylase family glycosyl hydrolase [Bacteroidota bacterium]
MKKFLFIVLFSVVCRGSENEDIIQPVKVSADRQDTILLSDMFYAKDYAITLTKNGDVAVRFLSSSNQLVVKANNNNFGATLVQFTAHGEKKYIPFIVSSAATSFQTHTFLFTAPGDVKKVTVEGSFNSWNKESHPLTKKNGVYSLKVNLEPGSYTYKFVVDGAEILDPSNSETAPTGFESFNSVLRIADPDSTKRFLHAGGRFVKGNEVTFSFLYENSGKHPSLKVKDVIALLDNGKVNEENIRISGDAVAIRFDKKELEGEKVFRILVTQQGKNTNLQQVQMTDGIPAGMTRSSKWDDGIIYSIMIDRFYDGDTSNDRPIMKDSLFWQANYQGGDLRGISKKLDDGYFDSLGINILWISPVYDNPNVAFREYPPPHRWYSGYHGYWPVSETSVEEKFGTMDEVKNLVRKAHAHGIKVLLDIVAHHVHIDNPLYKEHPDWFGTLDLPDGRKNLRLWDEQRLTTWFEPYMPSFDYTKSSAAIDYMVKNTIWWLKESGADGFRHDAVKHVPNEFWRALTRSLKEEVEIPLHKEVYQVGETFGDYGLVASYVNNGQLSAQFNFNLSYFAIPVFIEPDQSFASIDFQLKKSFDAFGANNVMGNIMDSHDKVRFMAYADGDIKMQGVDTREIAWNNPPTVNDPKSYDKANLYFAYMFTIPGLPVIYYGSEFGMTGADDPDNRRMMRFGDSLTVDEKTMLKRTEKVIALRNSHSALRYGDFYTLQADTNIYAYIRSDMNERLLVVLNKNSGTEHVPITLPGIYSTNTLVDAVTGEKISVNNHAASVTVPGVQWRIFTIH